MARPILITRPRSDDALEYLYHYSEKIRELAESKNVKVILCDKENANKSDVVSKITKLSPRFIFLNGHGERDSVAGHKDETLIKAGENEDILANSIVYVRSCSTAAELGSKAMEAGTKGFIGYEEPFMFVQDANKISNPLSDKVAEPVLDSSNIIPVSIINGNNLKTACEKSIETSKKWLHKIKSSEYPFHYNLMVLCLHWNMMVLKKLGNDDITINSL